MEMGQTDSFCPRDVSKINKEKNLKFIITSIPFSTQGKQLHLSLLQKKRKEKFSVFFPLGVSHHPFSKQEILFGCWASFHYFTLFDLCAPSAVDCNYTDSHLATPGTTSPSKKKKGGKKWPKGNRKNKLCPAWVLMRTFWTRQFNTPLVASLERIYSTSGIHSFPFSLVSRKKENKETMSNNNNYNSNNDNINNN